MIFPPFVNLILLELFQKISSQTIDPCKSLSDETTRYQYAFNSVEHKQDLHFIPSFIPTGILYTSKSSHPVYFLSRMHSSASSLESLYIKYTDPFIFPTDKKTTVTYVVLSVHHYYHTTSITSYTMNRNTSIDSFVPQKGFLYQKYQFS